MRKTTFIVKLSLAVMLCVLSLHSNVFSAPDVGYQASSELWVKAVLKVPGSPVNLVWKAVGTDITPTGAQVVSGYFYADPADFAYGSIYNPEVFVKVYIDPGGWANIAFNHVTVDDVDIYSAHHYSGSAEQTDTISLSSRLAEHTYTGVGIDANAVASSLKPTYRTFFDPSAIGLSSSDGGYTVSSQLWIKTILQVAGNPVTLRWQQVGADTTPSGDRVVSGYFYAHPDDFAYGSQYNPEVFVKVYIAANGWANIASNHVTVDDVSVYSAHQYSGTPNKQSMITLSSRLTEHQYNGVTPDNGNQAPVAYGLTRSVDVFTPYIEQQLEAFDADGDTLTYELISPSSGSDYSEAYINPSNGRLYVTIADTASGTINLSFRVTDGLLFSNSATIQITLIDNADEHNTGRIAVPPEQYAQFQLSTLNSNLLGAVGADPSQPRKIDLSPNFPIPGDQGGQSSCVGWAAAYALKSYQEKVEIGWSLNTADHLFSPAFLYNQINNGQDRGSYIHEALDLAVNQGIATLGTMPYSDTDYLTTPSTAATAEATAYKADSWYRVNDTSQIKAALVNRKPVVAGIDVYQQLIDLQGANSVYNTSSGQNQGGHAVTIVGYDDDRYGGAFKVINSWSQNWGDDGYFWMPYSFAAQGIISEAYVLIDAENSQIPTPPEEPTEPEPDLNTLPNLTVESWSATYDPNPRGTGSLTFTVANNGSGTAYAGADINLMLSTNDIISSYDTFVIFETIPFDLEPGRTAYRDEDNSIAFQFPDQVETGIYYMALWVDDLDFVIESNEDDNVSMGDSQVTITSDLPDLSVITWYAQWDQYGFGRLTYEVINLGESSTTNLDWYINLILDEDQIIDNGNEIFLFYETTDFYLDPGEYVYRDDSSAAAFYIYEDQFGYSVPSGIYYMALWVDDTNAEDESNEVNNVSYSWGTVSISGYTFSQNGIRDIDGKVDPGQQDAPLAMTGMAYNGKRLPSESVIKRRVQITRTPSGGTSMVFLDGPEDSAKVGVQQVPYTKTISSRSSLIFPSKQRIPMPGSVGRQDK